MGGEVGGKGVKRVRGMGWKEIRLRGWGGKRRESG
jgi:hypothetical protein